MILALISTVLSNPKVQAAIKNFALSIGETLGFQKEIESYTEILNMSQTDHGIIANIKEVVLDEGVLLFRVHAEIDNTEENEKKRGNQRWKWRKKKMRRRKLRIFHLLGIRGSHLIWVKLQ